MMEAQGYHMKRFYPAATTLETRIAGSGPLLQMQPGSITIKTLNTGTAMAHNVTLQLTFSSAPEISTFLPDPIHHDLDIRVDAVVDRAATGGTFQQLAVRVRGRKRNL